MGDIDKYDQFLIRWVAKALNGKNKFSIVCENYALSIQWLPVSSQTQMLGKRYSHTTCFK